MAANKHPDKAAIIAAYRAGTSSRDIALGHNLSQTSVWKIVKSGASEAMRSPGGQVGKRQSISTFVPEITGSTLEMLFSYDPNDGIFRHKTWRGPRGGGPGSAAGSLMKNGYTTIGLPGIRVLAHRLAWLWMTGKWPDTEIDHINGNRSDNRFKNLREANRVENSRNSGIRSNNTTGRVGVGFNNSRHKFQAQITINYKTINLGRFDCVKDAIKAREAAEEKYFGTFRPRNNDAWDERKS